MLVHMFSYEKLNDQSDFILENFIQKSKLKGGLNLN